MANIPVQTHDPSLRRTLTGWAVIGAIVFVLLFACGLAGTLIPVQSQRTQSGTNLRADYKVWRPILFPGLDPARVLDLLREIGVASGLPLLGGQGSGAPTASTTPFASPTSSPTPLTPTQTTPATLVPATRTPTNTGGGGPLSSPTPTHTPTPTASDTPVPTATSSSTPTSTATLTSTPTSTATPTSTPTHTATPTSTQTPTPASNITPTMCPGAGCPNLGAPDGSVASLSAGESFVIALGGNPIVVAGNPGPELAYYESASGSGILMDLVILEIGMTSDGTWFLIFNWGDQFVDDTNVAAYATDGEDPNDAIPATALFGTPYQTGILVDVDSVVGTPVPSGVYTWMRISAPTQASTPAPNSEAQIDAIEVFPTPTP